MSGILGKIWYVTGGVLACLSLGACSVSETAQPSSKTPTIVSLNPCIDAILVEVAQPEQILALSHYSGDPNAASMDVSRAREFGVTGGTAEEIIALQPDIVLASSFIAPATRNALERLELNVATFGIASDAETSAAQIREVAKLAGNTEGGEALIGRINAALAKTPNGKPRSAILWQPGQIVPGSSALVSELMAASGFSNHAASNGMGQADYLSLEALLANPPEVLLIAGDASGQRHKALEQLPDTQIASFDPSLLYCAGPTIIRAMERLEDIREEAAI
ncbi:MAG: ABC transporter substrate-binding protein [Marinomonas sp.]